MTREPLRPFLSNVVLLLSPPVSLKNAGQGKKKLMTWALQGFGLDVGTKKVGALEQQRLDGKLRKGVGEAVSEIQPRRMPAFAEVPVRLAGEFRLFEIDRHHLHPRAADEAVEFSLRQHVPTVIDRHGSLQITGGGYARPGPLLNGVRVA